MPSGDFVSVCLWCIYIYIYFILSFPAVTCRSLWLSCEDTFILLVFWYYACYLVMKVSCSEIASWNTVFYRSDAAATINFSVRLGAASISYASSRAWPTICSLRKTIELVTLLELKTKLYNYSSPTIAGYARGFSAIYRHQRGRRRVGGEPRRLLFESGVYFIQCSFRCGYYSKAVSNR